MSAQRKPLDLAEKIKLLRDIRRDLVAAKIECVICIECPMCGCLVGLEPPCDHARMLLDA